MRVTSITATTGAISRRHMRPRGRLAGSFTYPPRSEIHELQALAYPCCTITPRPCSRLRSDNRSSLPGIDLSGRQSAEPVSNRVTSVTDEARPNHYFDSGTRGRGLRGLFDDAR